VYVITEVDPSRPKNGYNGKNPATGKGYRLSDDGLMKIGVATAEYMDGDGEEEAGVSAVPPAVFAAGQRRAAAEAMFGPPDFLPRRQWEKLRDAKTGDTLTLRTRDGVQEATFRNVLARGHKFVFLATVRTGKTYKYPVGAIVL
jgi:hypothetical protein